MGGRTTKMLQEAVDAARRGEKVLVVMESRPAAVSVWHSVKKLLPGFPASFAHMRIDTKEGCLEVSTKVLPGRSEQRVFCDHAARL